MVKVFPFVSTSLGGATVEPPLVVVVVVVPLLLLPVVPLLSGTLSPSLEADVLSVIVLPEASVVLSALLSVVLVAASLTGVGSGCPPQPAVQPIIRARVDRIAVHLAGFLIFIAVPFLAKPRFRGMSICCPTYRRSFILKGRNALFRRTFSHHVKCSACSAQDNDTPYDAKDNPKGGTIGFGFLRVCNRHVVCSSRRAVRITGRRAV